MVCDFETLTGSALKMPFSTHIQLFQTKTSIHRHFPTFVDKFPTYVKKIGLLNELITLLYDLS